MYNLQHYTIIFSAHLHLPKNSSELRKSYKKGNIWPYLGHIELHRGGLSRLSSLKSENATKINADGIENGKNPGPKGSSHL